MKTSTFVSIASLALGASAAPADGPAWDSAAQGQRIMPRLDKSAPIDGGKRTEILYGPYTVQPGKMVSNKIGSKAAPCTNCYVTAMFATLRYPNGTEALTSHGAWLHHTVLSSKGGPLWAAGNERPTIRLNSKSKYGWDIGPSISYLLDIMSEAAQPFTVSMAVTYEWIDKNSAVGKQYKPAVMKWLSIGNPAPQPGVKSYGLRVPAKSTINGKLLYTIGHMHDGGTNLKLLINNKAVCDSIMFYDGGAKGLIKSNEWVSSKASGAAPAAKEHGHAMVRRSPQGGHAHGSSFGGAHIAQPGACTNYGEVKVGDSMQVEANYDFNKFAMMTHEGKTERLMGNCRVYIGPI